ncbi:hypothetical protein [Streptomyces sp. NPDC007905]|uniref:hypothetical protein n=1 Tax=Streptomyces sp. NPDC007905 TaxID=3364788 RepID=UPI0036E1FDFB
MMGGSGFAPWPAGIHPRERPRLGGYGEAVDALRTTMRAGGSGVLAGLFARPLIAGAWLGAVPWG